MATPIEQTGLGAGAKAAGQSAANAGAVASSLQSAQKMGGVLLKTLNDFAGPLALAAGWASGFALSMAKGVRQTELVQRGLERIAQIKVYSPEFTKLLGSLSQADKRLNDIWKWKSKSPFGFDDAVTANKRLEILTRGLLSTNKGMTQMGDLAAAGGTSLTEMASVVGTLHDNLANGRAIDGEIQALRMFGVISTDAANRLTLLAASGAGFEATWSAIQGELQNSAGSMKRLSGELTGLQQKLANAKENQQKTVGAQFEDGEKAGLAASIKMAEAMTPVYKSVAVVLGSVWSGLQKSKAAVVEFASAIPGLKGGLVGLILGFSALIGLLAAISFVGTIAGVVALVRWLSALSVSASLAAGATTLLGRSLGMLGAITLRLLGPWGLIIAAISAIVGLFADAAIEAGTFGKAQEDLKKSVDDTNKSIQEQIKGIQTQADKSTAIGAAAKNVSESEDRLAEAKAQQRKFESDWNPLNNESGKDAIADREKELEVARKTYQEARNAPTDAGVESTMGEDYAALKQQSEERQKGYDMEYRQLEAQRKAVESLDKAKRGNGFTANGLEIRNKQEVVDALGANGKSVNDISDSQKELAARRAKDADEFSKENMDRLFAQRQVMGGVRVDALREVFRKTGDTSIRDEADKVEDDLFRKRREKELIGQGFQGDAGKVAAGETDLMRFKREQERLGTPRLSSLAAIGGAAGFSGISVDIPRQQLERLKEISRELTNLSLAVRRSDSNSEEKYR